MKLNYSMVPTMSLRNRLYILAKRTMITYLKFKDAEHADKTIYYPQFAARDLDARETYKKEIRRSRSYKEDIFILDILREEMKSDDQRIQRILSE